METDWCNQLAEGLIESGCQYLSIALMEGGGDLQKQVNSIAERLKFPLTADDTISEKIGYEIALTYSYGKKRSAFLTHGFSLPVAMDPLMSSIYTGVAGGFVIITLDHTPPLPYSSRSDPVSLAMFAKMPVLELDSFHHLSKRLRHAFSLSEEYGTPVMLHVDMKIPGSSSSIQGKTGKKKKTDFEKNPARWAATPRFRFLLHKQLNQRLRKIAASDPRNLIIQREGTDRKLGILCNHANFFLVEPWAKRYNIPLLSVAMPFPLPLAPVGQFIQSHASVLVIEDRFPTIQFQLPMRENLKGRWTSPPLRKIFSWDKENLDKVLETWKNGKELSDIPGLNPRLSGESGPSLSLMKKLLENIRTEMPSTVLVADKTPLTTELPVDYFVSRGGAISVAAGFFHGREVDSSHVIGITDSAAFLHYGMQATTNAIYNTSRIKCLILVRPEHTRILEAFLESLEHVETVPFHPGNKNAAKRIKTPGSQPVTFYTITMEEAA